MCGDVCVVQERAAGADWKEFIAPDGRKYYYNRVTKESRWEMPEEMRGGPTPAAKKAATAAVNQPPPVQVSALEPVRKSPHFESFLRELNCF